jgi:hypothetical protein
MKRSTIITLTLIVNTIFLTTALKGQEENPKLARLQERVDAAQLKVVEADNLIFSADSLINAGEMMAKEAEAQLKILAQEKRSIDRDYFNARKPVDRLLRSKDKEDVKMGKAQLKAVENEQKEAMKDWNIRYKLLIKDYDTGNKIAEKGKANLKKAKDKKKDTEKKLKEAEKALDKAE